MDIISNLVEAHIFREVEKGIEFLLLKRAEKEIYPGIWQMVSGKMKKNEKAFDTALREIKEETGLIPEKMWAAPNVNFFYDHVENCISVLPVFAVKVCYESQVTISDEHTDFKWMNSKEAKKLLAWEAQRRSVDVIEQYFNNEKNFLKFVEIRV